MLRTRLDFGRLPMGDTTAGAASDRLQGFVALNVLVRVLRVPLNLDGAELEVDPRSSDATTQRTVARCGRGWSGGEFQRNSAAVAGAVVHGCVLREDVRVCGAVDCEA